MSGICILQEEDIQFDSNLPVNSLHTHINAHVVIDLQKQVVARLLLAFSCCDKTQSISLSPCYKVDNGDRLATSCSNKAVRNKLLPARCRSLCNNLLRADDRKLVGTTHCDYACWPRKLYYILSTSCKPLADLYQKITCAF